MSSPSDYTIGWICAISTEYVAAQEFLDEEHEGPEYLSQKDSNDYTLGRIGRHNVVIAVLPKGQYGLVSAANVAKDMLHSFPNVRFGLMVGIGGGAPSSKHDIRLGDVIVSTTSEEKGAVLQYDFGKTIQDKSFHVTGFLNQPPQILQTATGGLEAQYRRKGNRLHETICRVLQENPRLQEEYGRPDESTDNLYRSEILHDDGTCCTATSNMEESNMIKRTPRTEIQDDPAIHYGLVASANQLMKDASARDRLSKEKDVLCFEMEAAGLMNHFPCLVIRGICDYSDTHKNKQWQGYAAMAAAAYAKDLLSRIAPNKVEAEKKLEAVIDEGFSKVGEKLDEAKAGSHYQKLMNWLSPPDPSTNFNKALEQRHESSGQWFLRSPAYIAWEKEKRSFLWLNGIPGCGKTILSSAVVENLEQNKACRDSLLYFYFDFSDTRKQSFENLVCSLIDQLYRKGENGRRDLDSLYSSCDVGRRQPSIESLCATLQSMIQQAGEVWIVLDALDECQTRKEYPAGGILFWLQSLRNSQINVHLLITSRPEHDIEETIEKWARKEDIIPLQSNLIGDDIRAYIEARVRDSEGLSRWKTRPDIQKEIEGTLIEKARGMFRWVSCQVDILETCLGPPEVRKALVNLPKTLDDTYARILNNIPSEHRHYAKRILQILCFSERPLRIEEAVDAIAVDIASRPRFDPDNRIPVPAEISRYCSSLVVIVTRKGGFDDDFDSDSDSEDYNMSVNDERTLTEIQLAHFSVKEYLTSDRLRESVANNFKDDFEEIAARASIAKVCLSYLLDLDHTYSLVETNSKYPLAKYSARYWASHARVAEGYSKTIQTLEMELLTSRSSFKMCWELYPLLRRRSPMRSALYYASYMGLFYPVQELIHKGAGVKAQYEYDGAALYAASFGGHEKIVQLLLENGADANARDEGYDTALYAASSKGHEKIVQLLLENGADANARDKGYYDTALYAASFGGHEKIVQLLFENGADANARDEGYDTALYVASSKGHEKIVQLLLENGADANARDKGYYGTTLYAASFGGHEKVVQLLLENGADANARDKRYNTALYIASSKGHEKVVQLLLENGADANARNKGYDTALYIASSKGHEKIVQLLLENGADANARDKGYYGATLYAASIRGHEKVVQLLLENGAILIS